MKPGVVVLVVELVLLVVVVELEVHSGWRVQASLAQRPWTHWVQPRLQSSIALMHGAPQSPCLHSLFSQ